MRTRRHSKRPHTRKEVQPFHATRWRENAHILRHDISLHFRSRFALLLTAFVDFSQPHPSSRGQMCMLCSSSCLGHDTVQHTRASESNARAKSRHTSVHTSNRRATSLFSTNAKSQQIPSSCRRLGLDASPLPAFHRSPSLGVVGANHNWREYLGRALAGWAS